MRGQGLLQYNVFLLRCLLEKETIAKRCGVHCGLSFFGGKIFTSPNVVFRTTER
jgi:hypothetical protein